MYLRVPYWFCHFLKVEKMPNDVRNCLCDKLLNSVHSRSHRHTHTLIYMLNYKIINLSVLVSGYR